MNPTHTIWIVTHPPFPPDLGEVMSANISAEQKLKFTLIKQDSIRASSFLHVKNSFLFTLTVQGDVESKNELHSVILLRKSQDMVIGDHL